MNDKFSIRQLAFSLVPVTGEEEAAQLIKKAAQDNKLNDMQILELVRQVNVANQYHAFKKANYQVNGPGLDTITLDPSKIFEKLAKVAAFSVDRKKTFKFSKLKSETVKKTAALNLETVQTPDQEKYAFLKALVKQAKLENTDEPWEAIHTLEKKMAEELRQIKQAFITESSRFENAILPYPILRKKYASLIDESKIDPMVQKIPTARDMVEIKDSMEKIAELAEACSHLQTMYDILRRR